MVEVLDDGTTKKHPPHLRAVGIMLGIPTFTRNPAAAAWNQGVWSQSFEESVVLFARQSNNPHVADVLRFLSLPPDWFVLYKALEIVRFDLNEVEGRRAGGEAIVNKGWATTDQLKAFGITAEYHHRHWKPPAKRMPVQMNLIDARKLVGRIIANWIAEVSNRNAAS